MIEDQIRFCLHCGTKLSTQKHSGRMRPTCQNCGWVYFPDPKVAVAVLIKKDEKLLLVKRKYDPQKGFWTLPSGFVDAGEDPKQAAQRECLEETGLVVKDIQLIDVFYSQEHPQGASILILYKATVSSGELTPGDDAEQTNYFDKRHLPLLAFKSTLEMIERFL